MASTSSGDTPIPILVSPKFDPLSTQGEQDSNGQIRLNLPSTVHNLTPLAPTLSLLSKTPQVAV